jgi:DhnA family fructose-bisphosphate aldolase class Ia
MVTRATTLPILMLGGEPKGDPTPMLNEFASGMRAGNNVRGALVGRNILFPGADDPMATAEAVNKIVHNGFTAEHAADYIMANRGRSMNALTKWIK